MLRIKVGSESHVVYHKTIRLIRTQSKCARTYARKLSIVRDLQNARRTH